ncbi:uncharacterized protein SPPG_06569 [Spizellomyces punctatus DAOM BR117]|uniref:RRM domain-containing protein n=1 Tax=Spizellomyces punctatus (strain DAOM BR117) TaxID=645134 RepID=A0A0L0H9F1_SPIPD|nr:uncharacterized protein SPPG_06569 [Spizellomyces punctatus DAOM BR117]KNC98165.1 hypothetical protein SPPG_06569 [Spizellomyces punctatus DAOM BR117]|eukprot:XP_016606205.1 hypothetical protein SPPG_06569 [Spizellomyces punctatus DAOM BR117]
MPGHEQGILTHTAYGASDNTRYEAALPSPLGSLSWLQDRAPSYMSANTLQSSRQPMESIPPAAEARNPVSEDKAIDVTTAKACGSSLLTLLQLRPNVPSTTKFAVLKLSNIAWNLSISDVVAYFAPFKVPVSHLSPHYTQGVHIIMNRATGKTQSDCFVEFPSYTEAQRSLDLHARGILKGRIVVAQWSSQAELMDALFPHRSSGLQTDTQGNPSVETSALQGTMDKRCNDTFQSRRAVGSGLVYGQSSSSQLKEGVYLLREEINALLLVCRNYKLHFSRKCAERPFENIISIICKIPWHEPHLVSTSHRDHVFEMLKLSLESLSIHLSRHDHHIDGSLMMRMVRAGLCVPLFTERQKVTLLNVAGLPCPKDLAPFVYNPPQVQPSRSPDAKDRARSATPSNLGESSLQDLSSTSSTSTTFYNTVSTLEEMTCHIEELTMDDEPAQSTPVAKTSNQGAVQKTFSQAVSRSADLYPSPPDADGSGTSHCVATATPNPFSEPDQRLDVVTTPAMTLSLYAARIRMLEQALRQSETRYEELRRRHEASVTRSQVEQQELINAKLRTEGQCRDLESLVGNLEKANAELERRCSKLQQLLSANLRQEDIQGTRRRHSATQSTGNSNYERQRSQVGYLTGTSITSESVKSIWK